MPHARFTPTALDTATGFVLDFRLPLLDESHRSPNRAGYTWLVVGADTCRALALSFWSARGVCRRSRGPIKRDRCRAAARPSP